MGNKKKVENNFQLVKVVDDSNKPVKKGVTKITKDKNGLIAVQSIEIDTNSKMVERVKLTAESFHRALVENITGSNISLIDQILEAVVADAQEQAASNSRQHLVNRLGELNEAVHAFKQANIAEMKKYVSPGSLEGEESVWDAAIDIYGDGDINEIDDHNSGLVEAEVVSEEEQSFDI